MAYDLDKPFNLRVARFDQTNGFGGIISGHNEDISTTQEVLNPSGTLTYPSSADVVSVVSDSALDTSAGTGARAVFITGLDADWDWQSDEILLNGTTPVVTENKYIRLLKIWCTDVGTGGENVGQIIASIDGNAQECMIAGGGESHCAALSVPVGLRCYVSSMSISGGRADDVAMDLYTREFGQAWRVRAMDQVRETGKTSKFEYFFRIPEKSDIQLRVRKITSGTAHCTGFFNFVFLPISQGEAMEQLL